MSKSAAKVVTKARRQGEQALHACTQDCTNMVIGVNFIRQV